ncbi:fumarylacetoacetate hydrolase family protein [Microbacterium soli]|uniref:Fumarylacetoacetase-like C-terminal domain-containing protein n=1 Tax=Microbacterium soli TaxID=446075 RepID=A0ABP7NC52_9MICO
MKLVTYHPVVPQYVGTRLGVYVDGSIVDANYAYALSRHRAGEDVADRSLVDAQVPTCMRRLLAGGDIALERVREAVDEAVRIGAESGAAGERLRFGESEVRLRAPISRPGKILAAGKNYADHAAETAGSSPAPAEENPIPRGFVKVSSSVVGPGDEVAIPSVTSQLDYEVELAVVIGKRGRYIKREDVYDHIAGYTILNDISARDIQFHESEKGNHLIGKNMDGLAPMGPWLVTRDEISDPMKLQVSMAVNGEVRQNANTSTMIWDIPALVERWSWGTLEPGDVIATGTPAGGALSGKYPYLRPGDVMSASVDGLGTLVTPLVAE